MEECKFTDVEIIKALELCIQNAFCESCEYREKTDKSDICPIRTDALNLINKQKTELEQLKRNLEQCENGYSQELHLARCQLADAKSEVESIITLNSQLEAKVFEQRKEIERLKKYNTDVAFKHYSDGKAEVASEIFAEIEKVTYKDFMEKSQDFEFGYKIAIQEIIAELKKKYTE